MDRKKNLETILVLVLALIVLYKLKNHSYLLLIALIVGAIGLLIPWAAEKIHWGWMKLAEGIGFVMSKVLLTLIYFVVVLPFSFFGKKRKKSKIYNNTSEASYFVTRNFEYTAESMETMW
jgi:predicted membrane protein